jgi:hypothetical protein
MRYGPYYRIWLCDLSQSAGFCYALWAVLQDLVLRYESKRRILLCAMGRSEGFDYAL